MSIERVDVAYVCCDGCGIEWLDWANLPKDPRGLLDELHGGPSEARESAAAQGWESTKFGEDYCPECIEEEGE